jgi:hypothetical protein
LSPVRPATASWRRSGRARRSRQDRKVRSRRALQCGGSEVRIIPAAGPRCGLLDQSHTRFISCRCPFDSEVASECAARFCELRKPDTGTCTDKFRAVGGRSALVRTPDSSLPSREVRTGPVSQVATTFELSNPDEVLVRQWSAGKLCELAAYCE